MEEQHEQKRVKGNIYQCKGNRCEIHRSEHPNRGQQSTGNHHQSESEAIDNAYEKIIATTPPTTEEEQTHCEMIKEAVKGMFINESRTAAEAEFIKTHIVDYEKIFDVCMNGDDLEFKKGLVRLQKMQNEYVMQREND